MPSRSQREQRSVPRGTSSPASPGLSGAIKDATSAVGSYLKTRANPAKQISGRGRQIDKAVDDMS